MVNHFYVVLVFIVLLGLFIVYCLHCVQLTNHHQICIVISVVLVQCSDYWFSFSLIRVQIHSLNLKRVSIGALVLLLLGEFKLFSGSF